VDLRFPFEVDGVADSSSRTHRLCSRTAVEVLAMMRHEVEGCGFSHKGARLYELHALRVIDAVVAERETSREVIGGGIPRITSERIVNMALQICWRHPAVDLQRFEKIARERLASYSYLEQHEGEMEELLWSEYCRTTTREQREVWEGHDPSVEEQIKFASHSAKMNFRIHARNSGLYHPINRLYHAFHHLAQEHLSDLIELFDPSLLESALEASDVAIREVVALIPHRVVRCLESDEGSLAERVIRDQRRSMDFYDRLSNAFSSSAEAVA
jgi:hypothetical protein